MTFTVQKKPIRFGKINTQNTHNYADRYALTYIGTETRRCYPWGDGYLYTYSKIDVDTEELERKTRPCR